MTAQLLDITPDKYFELDAFSSSAAKTIHLQSPAHARAGYRKAPTKAMDRGDVFHKLLLGKGKDFEELDYDDYKTKDARSDRDAARAAGKTPILSHQLEAAARAAEAIRAELAARDIILNGRSEQVITWTEHTKYGDVPCKAMLDHVWLDTGVVIDIKTTENAAPLAVERTAENLAYGIQWAAYTRALTALDPSLAGRIAFAFVFCEIEEEPFALNVCEPDGAFQELGNRRWKRALNAWAKCLRDNKWPSYGTAVNPISAPMWAIAREGTVTDEL